MRPGRPTSPTTASPTDIEILTWLDDHSRYALSITAHRPVTGPAVVATFRQAIARHGTPLSTLTDSTVWCSPPASPTAAAQAANGLETEPPTTCGKVERFQQTMKRWLRTLPGADTTSELQAQLDSFADIYNHHRPHRSLPHRTTPAVAYTTRPKAGPGEHNIDTEFRVRHDRVSAGAVTLRVNGHLHHIGLGRPLDGTRVILLIDHLDVRVIHAATGEIIRALTINPERRYHGTGKPIGGPQRPYGPRKNKQPEP